RLQGNSQEADAWFGQALQLLDAMLQQDADKDAVQPFLRDLHWSRAVNLTRLGRQGEALQAWDLALQRGQGSERDALRSERATTVARTGEHTRATTEVKDLIERPDVPSRILSNLACMFAACAVAARQDGRLSQSERDQQAEHYAARGVELLTRA